MAVNPIEVRLAHLEGAYEQITHRLGAIEGRLGSIESRMERLEDKLLARMDRQFYWVLTLIVLSILVPISLRVLNL